MEEEVIRLSHSPWASPIVLVRKKWWQSNNFVSTIGSSTRWPGRMPTPFRGLTTPWTPSMVLVGSLPLTWWVGIGRLRWGNKIEKKTAFCTPYGLYEFNVMPFGLCNGPATFLRLMDLVLAGLQMTHCLEYIDDVIVVGRSFNEHLCNIRDVFKRVREAGMKLKPSKCVFFREKVFYFGHEVSREGVVTAWPQENWLSCFLATSTVSQGRSEVPRAGQLLPSLCQRLCNYC